MNCLILDCLIMKRPEKAQKVKNFLLSKNTLRLRNKYLHFTFTQNKIMEFLLKKEILKSINFIKI